MNTYNRSKHRSTGRNIRKVIVGIALIGLIVFLGETLYVRHIDKSIRETHAHIGLIQEEAKQLEEQIPLLEEDKENLLGKAAALRNIIWRFQPVVIPSSMQ